MDLSVVVPCYNEIDNVEKLRDELVPVMLELSKTRSVELVFVDDGSTDGTFPALKEALGDQFPQIAIKYEDNHGNWGLGKALRTGFNAASGDVIVTTDSDGTYAFDTIPTLLEYLTPEVDVVTASPYHPMGEVVGVAGYRLLLSKGSSLIYRILVDWHVYTYTALFRAYRRSVIENVNYVSNSFLGGTEMLVKTILCGYKVVDYPAVLHSRAHGVSKAKLMRTIMAHLRFQSTVLLDRLHITSLEPRRPALIRTKYNIV
jgi:dolichol-phosphate mannosyltransferase